HGTPRVVFGRAGARAAGRRGAGAEVDLLRPDHRAAREERRALDDVAELAHVAGPVVRPQAVERRAGERERRAAQRPELLLEEVAGEERDLLPPASERRQLDPRDLEPV